MKYCKTCWRSMPGQKPLKAPIAICTCAKKNADIPSGDTPETDEQLELQRITIPWQDVVVVEFAQRLERERNEARRDIAEIVAVARHNMPRLHTTIERINSKYAERIYPATGSNKSRS